MLYRAHVPILNVLYDDNVNYRDWQNAETVFQAVGQDPVGPGWRLCTQPPKTILESGTDAGNFQGVALHYQNGELRIVSEMVAGWYRYVSDWRMRDDGTIGRRDLDSRARETRERACGINITCTGVSISISTVQPTTRSRCSAWSFRQAAAQPDWSGAPSSKKHSGSATRLYAADTVSWTKRVDPATKSGPARWMARPITTASQTCGFSGTTAKRSMMAFPSSGDKYRPRRRRQKSPDSSVETRWTVKTFIVVWYAGHYPARTSTIRIRAGHIIGPDLVPHRW